MFKKTLLSTTYYILYSHVLYFLCLKVYNVVSVSWARRRKLLPVVCWPVNIAVLILYDGMSTSKHCCTSPYGGLSICKQCCIHSIWVCCKIVQYCMELLAASNSMAVSVMMVNVVHGSSVNVSVWNIVHVELIFLPIPLFCLYKKLNHSFAIFINIFLFW